MTGAERQKRRRIRARIAEEAADRVALVLPKIERSYVESEEARKRRQTRQQIAYMRRGDNRPFVGFDGEGWGQDDAGRQRTMILRMGERELFTGEALSTRDCLAFIAAAPRGSPDGPIYVSYSLGYEVTMILAGVPQAKLRAIFARSSKAGANVYTWVGPFGVNYLPGNYFRVCRLAPDGSIIDGSARTISDVSGFWRESFLAVLQRYDIGNRSWAMLQTGKVDRENPPKTAKDALTVRHRCERECNLLSQVMQQFRRHCIAAGVRPRLWQGAGKLANALHIKHETITAADIVAHRPAGCAVPAPVLVMAQAAYYGGRFETPRLGDITGPVYEYDRRSAYPAAMTQLPCLKHGTWRKATPHSLRTAPPGSLYVAAVRFKHDPVGPFLGGLCGLPVRRPDGRLVWPEEGNGTYWSCEIESAASLGARVIFREGWHFEKRCECRPFDWIAPLYAARQEMTEAAGYPLKIGTGSALYGKFAQRIGTARYQNFVWAGLVTAIVRAEMNHAAALRPGSIAMVATDGIWSTTKLDLPIGPDLGEYREIIHPRLFIHQPGLYWTGERTKSRGIGVKFFADKTEEIETLWHEYVQRRRAGFADLPPRISFRLRLFVGLRLAMAMERPDRAGHWTETPRGFSFAWAGKRGQHVLDGDCVVTAPLPGGRVLDSADHMAHPEEVAAMDQTKLEIEDQPDWVDLSPP